MDRRATLPPFPPDDLGDASNLPSLRQLFPEHLRMEAANYYQQQQQSSVQEATTASRPSAYPAQIQLPQQQQGPLSPSPMSGYHHPPAHPQQYAAYATQPPSAQPVQGSSQGVLLPVQSAPRELDSKYDCPYCGKRFDRPSSVKIHITSHTGEKPFVCAFPGCGRRFSVNSNMRRHLRTHAAQPQAASAHDSPDAEEDEPPRPPQHRPPRSAPAVPTMPPIMPPQPHAHPQHPQSPAAPSSYQQYQMQQQPMLGAQAAMRPPSQPQPPQHGAAMLHSQPQHQAPPGVAMPQYAGYAAYGQYGGYAPATPESIRWMSGAGLHQGGQPDYAPR